MESWQIIGLLMVGGLLFLMTVGVPVAGSLGLVAFVAIALGPGFDLALSATATSLITFWTHYSMIALPLFILMGELLMATGIVADIFDVTAKWLRRLRGGIALVTTAACAAFGTLSGTSLGATATIGRAVVPEMLERGYSPRLATGVVGAAGGLAHLIPPSGMAIVYAALVEVSAGKQLFAGLVPGFILAAAYATVVLVWVTIKPGAAPTEPPVSWRERIVVLRKVFIPVVIMLSVLGTIYTGIATVVEAAAVGAFATFLLSIYKRVSLAQYWQMLMSVARTLGFIMLIAGMAKLLTWALSYYLVPQHVIAAMSEAGLNRWLVLIGIQVLMIFMGMFLDPLGIMFIVIPVTAPIVAALGFDLITFGVLFLINMEVASVTPPLGFHLYIIKGVCPPEVKMTDIMWGCLTFVIADISILMLTLFVPVLSLWLPNMMMR